MTKTYEIKAEAFNAACSSMAKAASVLLTLDEAQLLDHVDCPPEQSRKVMAALDVVILARNFVDAGNEALLEAAISDEPRQRGNPAAEAALNLRWERAERALAETERAINAAPKGASDAVMAPLVDAHTAAEHAIVRLPAATMTQALRRIEIAASGGTLTGVDLDELISEAKGLL